MINYSIEIDEFKCYQSFVRSFLEYSAPIWSPYAQCDILQLEKVQRGAAHYVMNNYSHFSSVLTMLDQLP